jgi:sugar phosphate isomerase/epimerase
VGITLTRNRTEDCRGGQRNGGGVMESYQFGVSEFTTMPWMFEQDVENYVRLGVQAIEVCEAKLDPARMEEQIALPGARGLKVTSIQPATRTLFPSKGQPEPLDIGERLARFRQTITRLAPSVPDSVFVTNTGIPPDGNIQLVWDTAVREYRELAAFAADFGARVALEPLNASIVNIETAVWTLPQAMEIVQAVGHDSFGICLDCWNVWQNADILDAIRQAGDRIFVVQISDWRTPRSFEDRLVPGQGEIPLPAFLRAVRETGFAGAYSVEIFSRGVPDALWEADLEQVIRDSRAGLDRAWRESWTEGVG